MKKTLRTLAVAALIVVMATLTVVMAACGGKGYKLEGSGTTPGGSTVTMLVDLKDDGNSELTINSEGKLLTRYQGTWEEADNGNVTLKFTNLKHVSKDGDPDLGGQGAEEGNLSMFRTVVWLSLETYTLEKVDGKLSGEIEVMATLSAELAGFPDMPIVFEVAQK